MLHWKKTEYVIQPNKAKIKQDLASKKQGLVGKKQDLVSIYSISNNSKIQRAL